MLPFGYFMSSVPYSYYFVPGDYMCDLDPESQKLRSLLEDTLSGGSWSDVSSETESTGAEHDFSDEFSDEYEFWDYETDDSSLASSTEDDSEDEKEEEDIKTVQPQSVISPCSEFELVDMSPSDPDVNYSKDSETSQSNLMVASTSFCEGVELQEPD